MTRALYILAGAAGMLLFFGGIMVIGEVMKDWFGVTGLKALLLIFVALEGAIAGGVLYWAFGRSRR
jgi:hypothetical protein